MMEERIVVVGSGASGVHFAWTALQNGHRVLMIDVGRRRRVDYVRPADDFEALKSNLEDPVQHFLGDRFEALILPGHDGEYYGFPPEKSYVFEPITTFRHQASGFSPLFSFAAGGLAEAWTGGSYPFNDGELGEFPFGYEKLAPYYSEVARRIGISGEDDDLARFYPLHDHIQEPLVLDEHSDCLLKAYQKCRHALNEPLGCYVGRARIATLTRDLGGRKACSYTGRCLWGCPTGALYIPSLTLEQCRQHENFEYLDGHFATHFRFDSGRQVRKVVSVSTETGETVETGCSSLVLAAGTLCSSMILMRSIYEDSGQLITLSGLMDNRQVLMPFLNLRMIGKPFEPKSYQYHQLAIGVDGGSPMDYVHGLVTTLKTALIHPIIQSIPMDLGTSVRLFRNLHAALGLVNVNFSDNRRESNYLCLEPTNGGPPRLVVHYQPEAGEPERIARTIRLFRKILWKLGCVAPPPMTHIRPMGASVHYAGTIPMSRTSKALTCTEYCQSHDFENLYFADGCSFPALPAKNLTFTLMANAVRVAEQVFG